MDDELPEAVQKAGEAVARALDRLGTGNAATDVGAIELLADAVKHGTERIADAINNLAEAIRERE